jgi:hypothetical protein
MIRIQFVNKKNKENKIWVCTDDSRIKFEENCFKLEKK